MCARPPPPGLLKQPSLSIRPNSLGAIRSTAAANVSARGCWFLVLISTGAQVSCIRALSYRCGPLCASLHIMVSMRVVGSRLRELKQFQLYEFGLCTNFSPTPLSPTLALHRQAENGAAVAGTHTPQVRASVRFCLRLRRCEVACPCLSRISLLKVVVAARICCEYFWCRWGAARCI